MKFCRNLQRVIDITDPEWAPYWTNYKMLKKFLKQMPSIVSAEGDQADCDPVSLDGERKTKTAMVPIQQNSLSSSAVEMRNNPGEVAFFKLVNSELKKAIHFFDKAQLEYEIREARVREGIDIMKKASPLMVSEKWSLMAKSLYRLYKDLLLLETYAIMTYCSFSKILKKHDKVTRHNTRTAFMANVVNKANFAQYPRVSAMITRCERLYDEVSNSLIQEGKSGLYEDERLFINMIHRLNEQVLDTAQEEGAPEAGPRKELRRTPPSSPCLSGLLQNQATSEQSSSSSSLSDPAANALRSLVEENALNKSSKAELDFVDQAPVQFQNEGAMNEKKRHCNTLNLPIPSMKRNRT